MGTSLVAHFPKMPPSVKNGDNAGSKLSANAAVGENGDLTGECCCPWKTETILVAHFLQMPPPITLPKFVKPCEWHKTKSLSFSLWDNIISTTPCRIFCSPHFPNRAWRNLSIDWWWFLRCQVCPFIRNKLAQLLLHAHGNFFEAATLHTSSFVTLGMNMSHGL